MDSSVPDANTQGANAVEAVRLFALLIGINTYNVNHACNVSTDVTGFRASAAARPISSNNPSLFGDLRGAVADAEAFYEYLVENLNVPKNQITFLRDKEATRDKIVKALQALSTNEDIKRGDSIFIFYAGHGAQAYPPMRLKNKPGCPEYTEVLVPHDYNKDPANVQKMGIPDYTLAVLLNNISKEKGDKITVVFDCCHSASALRGPKPADDVLTRSGPELNYHIPDDLDEDIWGLRARGLTEPPSLKHLGTGAYIFFSACTSAQMAREMSGRGCFTRALVGYLEASAKGHEATCSDIIPSLKEIDGQDPQCQGKNINERSIFHGYTPPRKKQDCFDIHYTRQQQNSSEICTLKAGFYQGLSQGDELTVYASKIPAHMKDPIATVVIDSISSSTSSLQFQPGSSPLSLSRYPNPVAVLAKSTSKQPHFILYIDNEDPSLSQRVSSFGACTFTGKIQDAHIRLSLDNTGQDREKQLRFDVVDTELLKRHVKLNPHYIPDTDEYLADAINGLSHYYYHLKRTSSSLPTDKITLSLFQVEDNASGHPTIVRTVDSPNIISQDGAAIIGIVEGTLYGMDIHNNTQEVGNLFPVLLYFDNSDFTISQAFPHATKGENTEAPWPAKGQSITIGYGVGPGSDVLPFQFFLSEGNDIEAGFFKLFLFDTSADLQSVVRDKPLFTQERGMRQARAPSQIEKPKSTGSRWGSITVPVIQKRAAAN